jgi:hypothetical protein
MFPRWEYSLFQRWFRRTLAFQKPLAFLSEIINCFTNIFDSKQLKYSPKVYIFALRHENGNSRRNEPLFLVSVDKLPTCCQSLNFLLSPFPWATLLAARPLLYLKATGDESAPQALTPRGIPMVLCVRSSVRDCGRVSHRHLTEESGGGKTHREAKTTG